MKLTILSGGAANGLVAALGAAVQAETGADIDGTFGAVGAMRDKLVGGASADLLDSHLGADRRADQGRPRGGGLGGRPRRDRDRRRGAQRRSRPRDRRCRCAAGGVARRRRHLFSRPQARDRRHPFRQGAGAARHRRGGRAAPAHVSERPDRHGGARRPAGRPADRLHADHRDPQHQGRRPWSATCRRTSRWRPSTRSASAPRRSRPSSRAASPRCSPARTRASCAASSASPADRPVGWAKSHANGPSTWNRAYAIFAHAVRCAARLPTLRRYARRTIAGLGP